MASQPPTTASAREQQVSSGTRTPPLPPPGAAPSAVSPSFLVDLAAPGAAAAAAGLSSTSLSSTATSDSLRTGSMSHPHGAVTPPAPPSHCAGIQPPPHSEGTETLAHNVMKWAMPSKPNPPAVNDAGAPIASPLTDYHLSPVQLAATYAYPNPTESSEMVADSSAMLQYGLRSSQADAAAESAKTRRLRRMVRDLHNARKFLLKEMAKEEEETTNNDEDGEANDTKSSGEGGEGAKPQQIFKSGTGTFPSHTDPMAYPSTESREGDESSIASPVSSSSPNFERRAHTSPVGRSPMTARAQHLGSRLMETLRLLTKATQDLEDEEDAGAVAMLSEHRRRERAGSIPSSGALFSGQSAAVMGAQTARAVSTSVSPPPPHGDYADPMDSGSPFFHSPSALETSRNRLREIILSLNRAAQTDAELLWLFRNSRLLCLLPREAQERAVRCSLRREYSRGETILEKGVPIRHVYVVVWGEVDAFQIIPHDETGSAAAAAATTRTSYSATAGGYYPPPAPSAAQFISPSAKVIVPIPLVHPPRRLSGSMESPAGPFDASGVQAPKPGEVSTNRYCRSGGFRGGIGVHQGTLSPGQVFGVEQCVFDSSSEYCFRASLNSEKTVIALIPVPLLRELLKDHTRFAQGTGDAITAAVDVFKPIREFCRSVFSASTDENEYLPLWAIVEKYTELENVIHTKLLSRELDTGAWGYALNRLPANVTTTFCFNLVHALPPFVATRMRSAAQAADVRRQQQSQQQSQQLSRGRTTISFITTKERRRCTWHLGMEGKTLVLLRDGFTDLLDFLTMLCVHIIESNKLRGRLQGMVHPPAIDVLDDYLQERHAAEEREGRRPGQPLTPEEEQREMERVKQILRRMPLTPDEQAGLIRLWKSDTALKMFEVMMHREEYNVRVDPSLSRKFQINPFHEWALNLRACVLKKIGLRVIDPLPEDLYIDVVSSNTHCIKNLLSSFNRKYKKDILEYARECEQARLGPWEEWHNEEDILYSALTGFLQHRRPDLKEEYAKSLERSGITVLHDTAMTGLQVDVIPVHTLHLQTIDKTIRHSVRNWFNELFRKDDEVTDESEQSWQSLGSEQCSTTSPGRHRSHHGTSSSMSSFTTAAAQHSSSGPRDASVTLSPTRRKAESTTTAADKKPHSPKRLSWAQVCKPVRNADGNLDIVCGLPPHLKKKPGDGNDKEEETAEEGEEEEEMPEVLGEDDFDDANPYSATQAPRAGVYRLRRHFIINMDFAFGAQAEGICRAVFSAFGHRIRSVSVMGKAGGMVGKRGDIQLASHVLMSKSSLIIEDNQDELRNCRNDDLKQERLQELAGPRVKVFKGNVLTVTGTMLQNERLLRYYQRVWGCVGMEMEGSYFARVIEDFHQQGITRPDMITRFAYYTSDLPLAESDAAEAGDDSGSATLSSPMTPLEGVPPLYAIARGILERILLP